MKTKEQAQIQVDRILHRLAIRLNAVEFQARALRILNYIHDTYCQ